jgi:hypothetical protein
MKYTEIIKLSNQVKIYADPLNWVLEIGNKNNRSFFHSIDALCDELFDMRLTQKLLRGAPYKTAKEIEKVVGDTRKATREDIEQLKEVWTGAEEARKKPFRKDIG